MTAALLMTAFDAIHEVMKAVAIQSIATAAFRVAALFLATAMLPVGCASKKEEPADEQRAQAMSVEHRVFYEGWLHPSRPTH